MPGTDDKRERPMTLSEAGRKGGQTVLKKYGPEFYARIGEKGGEKGGEARKKELGHDGYVQLGHKGGAAVVQKYGAEHMAKIGKRGGERGGQARVEQSRRLEIARREEAGSRGGAASEDAKRERPVSEGSPWV